MVCKYLTAQGADATAAAAPPDIRSCQRIRPSRRPAPCEDRIYASSRCPVVPLYSRPVLAPSYTARACWRRGGRVRGPSLIAIDHSTCMQHARCEARCAHAACMGSQPARTVALYVPLRSRYYVVLLVRSRYYAGRLRGVCTTPPTKPATRSGRTRATAKHGTGFSSPEPQ